MVKTLRAVPMPLSRLPLRFVLFAAVVMAPAGCRGGSRAAPGRDAPGEEVSQRVLSGERGMDPPGAALSSRDQASAAAEIMLDFAARTGVATEAPGRRYLWTDAFAVCNYLGLARATGDARYAELALRLIDRVHGTLGKHRPEDRRTGWISGLDAQQGAAHPTRGGLRIGKDLPERSPGEPFDERLEWERDGQYLHYLTKWMVALDQAARSTGRPSFNVWARELAETAHRAFAHGVGPGSGRRLYWKMSIDLSRPAVPSMGQHDALDGYVTCEELRATAAGLPGPPTGPTLEDEAADFASMIDRGNLETADPLGLGGLLADAYRVAQLAERGSMQDAGLREALLAAALSGLEQYAAQGDLDQPAERRLAFRELGLAIGLAALDRMQRAVEADREGFRQRDVLHKLLRYGPLRVRIVDFWLEPAHRRASSWTEHRDINDVMLATALAPEGFLVLRPPVTSSRTESP